LSMIKSEVMSLLILNLVITPSLISERPLTIVSFEVRQSSCRCHQKSNHIYRSHGKRSRFNQHCSFLRVCINIILGCFFKNTLYFNSVLLLFLSFSKFIYRHHSKRSRFNQHCKPQLCWGFYKPLQQV
jgi:hypothetical protein